MTNLNNYLTFCFIVILLGWLVVYLVAEVVPLTRISAGGLWLIAVFFYQISFYSFSTIVSMWCHAINYCPWLHSLKFTKWTPQCHQMPVYCHVSIFCSQKPCTCLSHHHLQFKTRKHLCSPASTVSYGIKPCIMPPFNSDVFIIGVESHASQH